MWHFGVFSNNDGNMTIVPSHDCPQGGTKHVVQNVYNIADAILAMGNILPDVAEKLAKHPAETLRKVLRTSPVKTCKDCGIKLEIRFDKELTAVHVNT